MDLRLEEITQLASFKTIFSKLKDTDAQLGNEVENAFTNALDENHKALLAARNNPQELIYRLFSELLMVQDYMRRTTSCFESVSLYEADLLRFEIESTNDLFDRIGNRLDNYFQGKKEAMQAKIAASSDWHTGFRDTSKHLLKLGNVTIRGLRSALVSIGKERILGDASFDENTLVESILKQELAVEGVASDVANLFEAESQEFCRSWESRISKKATEFPTDGFFRSTIPEASPFQVGFHMCEADQAAAVGLGSAVAGTLGVAAGWHTLSYAILNVFPPIAVFSAIAALGMSVWHQDKALETRQKQISDAVNEFHRHFLLQLETEPLAALENRTLRQEINKRSTNLVNETIKSWERRRLGGLTRDYSKEFESAAESHMAIIKRSIELIRASP